MSKLILHIGTHKSGTTWFQNVMAANRAVLAQHDVIYPDFRAGTGHHGLLTKWMDLPPAFTPQKPPERLIADLAAQYARRDVTVIFSSEEFSRARGGHGGNGPDLAELRAMLSDFDEITVVCTLRDQVAFLQSLYVEVSRKQLPPRPPTLVEQAMRSGYAVGMFMDYNLLLTRLEAAFPADRLCLVDYLGSRSHPEGVLGTILAAAGCPQLTAILTLPASIRSNVSEPPLATWIGNILSEPDPIAPELRPLVLQKLQRELGEERKTTLFLRSEVKQMRQHFARLNRNFESRVNRRHRPEGEPFQLTEISLEGVMHREDVSYQHWVSIARAMYNMKTR